MNKKLGLLVTLFSCFIINTFAQTKKFDTTVKMGDVGYKVYSNNKKPDKNSVSITPMGFNNYSNALNFPVVGIVSKALIDDFNNDGYPDLLFYSFDDKNRAQIYALASVNNTSCAPIYMPDIYIDAKLRDGYQGQDELSTMGGFLLRKFPIYQVDTTTKTTSVIGKRVVEYKAKKVESSNPDNPTFKFEIFKSYDEKK